MTAFERNESTKHKAEQGECLPAAEDFGPLFNARFSNARETEETERPERNTDGASQNQPKSDKGLFGQAIAVRLTGPTNGSCRSKSLRAKPARAQPSLFDLLPRQPVLDGQEPTSSEERPVPVVSRAPVFNKGQDSPEPATSSPQINSHKSSFDIASGEKSKARDIIGAIRTAMTIEREGRRASSEERQALSRFAGFGPVALSIFPDPVTGRFKDSGWQALGVELKALLTPEEYDSAKRTTFNAFYTSPTVIGAIYEAIARTPPALQGVAEFFGSSSMTLR